MGRDPQGYISTGHWKNRANNKHPDSQNLTSHLYRALGFVRPKKNKLTQDDPDRCRDKAEEETPLGTHLGLANEIPFLF